MIINHCRKKNNSQKTKKMDADELYYCVLDLSYIDYSRTAFILKATVLFEGYLMEPMNFEIFYRLNQCCPNSVSRHPSMSPKMLNSAVSRILCAVSDMANS